jgi:hypothetical protein
LNDIFDTRIRRGEVGSHAPVQIDRELLPILYLKGISTGDFSEAAALLGKDAAGLYRPPEGRLARRAHRVAGA